MKQLGREVTRLFFMMILACGLLAFAVKPVQAESLDLSQAEDSPEWVAELKEAAEADQLFVIAGVGQTTAYVSMHQKAEDGTWKQIMTTPGYIGKKGLDKEKEGDAKTPTGVFAFNYAFGIAEDPGCAISYQQVTEDDYWSGDQRDGYGYNQMVSIKDLPDLNTDDSEHIVDYINEYQYCLNISYNEEGTPGLGSAIFLHCLGAIKPYTGGCVAIPQDKMLTVMQNVTEDCVVVIDSMDKMIPSLWESLNLSGVAGGRAQTVTAYLDQDGNTVVVKADVSGGWTASFARGAVYLYDGEDDGERSSAAMAITLEQDVYEDYVKDAPNKEAYQEEDGVVSYVDENGESIYLYPVGDNAYFMITVSEGYDGAAVAARITAEPEVP